MAAEPLYTVKGPPGRSHSTTSMADAIRTIDEWEREGFTVTVEESTYREPVYNWAAVYPDGNYPE